jgi:uncharacterized cupredoxin-like copper-binding protein
VIVRRHVAAIVAVGAIAVTGVTVARASAPAEIPTAVVTIHYSHFSPSSFSFAAGETVRFVIRNKDPIDHEFILGDRTIQIEHEHGTQRYHVASPGIVSVPAGSTRITTYTFGAPGPSIIGCHLPGHYAYGMRAPVTVT